jgi:hypothetical protein
LPDPHLFVPAPVEPELTEFLIEPELVETPAEEAEETEEVLSLVPLPSYLPEPEPEPQLELEPELVLEAVPLPDLADEIDLSSLLDERLPELTFVDAEPEAIEPEFVAPPPMLVPVAPPIHQQPPPGTNVQQVITIPTGAGTHVQAAVNVAVAVSVQVAASVHVSTPPPRRGKPKPIQDEWGFFDPSQCGFPALLAKLDEIAQKDEES